MRNDRNYAICAAFDTETTNYGEGANTVAFTILYIFNDLRLKDLKHYKLDIDDNVKLYRTKNEALKFIQEIINFGKRANVIPIICAYNAVSVVIEGSSNYDIEVG